MVAPLRFVRVSSISELPDLYGGIATTPADTLPLEAHPPRNCPDLYGGISLIDVTGFLRPEGPTE